MKEQVDSQVFHFRGFTLDLARGMLMHAGQHVPLRPKSLRLLAYLAAHAGRVVTKSELMDAVWTEVAVTEDSLTQCVRDIRKVLGREQRLLRTVARKGYLFEDAQPDRAESTEATRCVVAVLPFHNDGGDEHAAFTDGVVEEVTNGLAHFRVVAVIARNSSFGFRPENRPDSKMVGERLGAGYLVEGAVRRRAGRLTVAVELIDAPRGVQVWCERFDVDETDVFSLQDTIARQIVSRLATRLEDAGLQRSARKPTQSLGAYELLLRGVARLRAYGTGNNEEARGLFEQAVAIDPEYGLAHSYLALARVVIAGYAMAPAAVLADAMKLATRGVALAPEEARTHRILALVRLYLKQHEQAEHHLQRSLTLNPYDADTLTQMGYLLTMRGRPEEAIKWMDRAVQLNPLHPDWYHFDRALALYSLRDYRAAASAIERLPRLGPGALTRLAACYAQLGETDVARRHLERAKEVDPDFSPLDYMRHGIAFEQSEDIAHVVTGITLAALR
jgi:TolB-like protein/Tfp pilus assembly protein PilF